MGRQLGRCKKCNCQATIDERDSGICIWCAVRKLENEDISWLLAERDRLRAELARVKAESLRVVESECQDMNLASDWYMTPDGLGWLGYDRHDCECVETPHGYRKFDECRKVKLGRWEDE